MTESWLISISARRPVSGSGTTWALPNIRLDDDLDRYDWIVLQYQPFMYGRWGVAPWLVAALARLRLRRRRPRVALMAHEMLCSRRRAHEHGAPMGTDRRGQLAAIRVLVDVVYVSIEAWTRQLAAWWPRR